MKKFFTNIPHQEPVKLKRIHYEAMDNPRLQLEEDTSFPILAAINGYAEAGEEIRIIAVTTELAWDLQNCDTFAETAEELCRKKGLKLPNGVEFIHVKDDESVSVQSETFLKLIEKAEENDELYSCLTFGTKPQAMALQLAIQYAYRVNRNTSIGCILYGKYNWRPAPEIPFGQIFDMTLLIRLDELVRLLADKRIPNPKEIIRKALSE